MGCSLFAWEQEQETAVDEFLRRFQIRHCQLATAVCMHKHRTVSAELYAHVYCCISSCLRCVLPAQPKDTFVV